MSNDLITAVRHYSNHGKIMNIFNRFNNIVHQKQQKNNKTGENERKQHVVYISLNFFVTFVFQVVKIIDKNIIEMNEGFLIPI